MGNNTRTGTITRFSVLMALCIGVFFWLLETAVELFLLHPEARPIDLLFPRDFHELWMRTLTVLLAISTTIIVYNLYTHRRMGKILKQSEENYHRNYLLQKTIATVLQQTMEPVSMRTQMERILDSVLETPLLQKESIACIFSFDEKSSTLKLHTQKGAPEDLQVKCSSIELGQCLCGKAALRREIIFSKHTDDSHEIHYEGMPPHDQYCIPVLSGDRLLGVLTFYVKPGHERNKEDDSFLLSISNAIAMAMERKQADITLHDSEEKFRSLFDQASESIFLLSSVENDLIIEDVNEAACAIHGYTREELIGTSIGLLDDRETRERIPEREKLLMSGQPLKAEAVHLRKDGTTFPIEISARLIHIGERPYVLAIDRDITERKRAEEALEISQKALKSVLDGLEAIVYVTDMTTHEVLYMNQYTKNVFGDQEGNICWQVLQTDQSGPCKFCTNDKLLTPEGLPKGVYHWKFQNTVNGRWYDIRDRAIPWVDGRTTRLEIATDITDIKKTEEELYERMKLAQLNADIGVSLTEGETLREMVQGCTEALVRHLDALFARIWIFNEEESILELKASAGLYTRLDGKHSRKQLGKYKIGIIAEERRPVLTNAVIGDPNISDQEWAKREKVTSFAGHPLVVENRLMGVMGLFSRHQLTDITLKALKSISDIIALGIEQKHADDKILIAKEEWENTFDIIPDLISVVDNNYRIVRANRSLVEILGIKREEIIGQPCYSIMHGSNAPPDYCPHKRCLSERKECVDEIYEEKLKGYYILSANPILDKEGNVTASVHVARNISKRKEMEKKLEEAAITDELTGLFNRRGFFTLADQQCKLADRSKKKLSLLYLDLDGFKTINDELGHNAGDQALADMANILNKTFRSADIIGRIGGDEFAVLLTEPSQRNIDDIVKRHFRYNLNTHNEQAGRSYELLVSMGMSQYDPEHPCSVSDLLSAADTLMYRDKKYHKLKQDVAPLLEEESVPKRVYERFSTGDNCWAELDISGKIKIKNISLRGACLKTPEPLTTESICKIKILPNEEEEIMITGVVVWVSPSESEVDGDNALPYKAGLKFIELSDSIKSSLEGFTENFNM